MRNPEGESDRSPLRPCFDRRLKLEFHGSRVTADAGLLAYRELDDALGLTVLASDVLADSRTGKNGWHGVVGLLRQSVFGRLAGYEDVNDADRLGRDPAMRWVVGGKAVERGGASTSQMGRFETELLTIDDNLAALTALPGVWIDRVHARNRLKIIVLDMDSSVSPTHGEQEGTAYNGHFGCTCYHPLFVFNQFGDLERCALRPGNVHSAHEWRDVLEPVVARYRDRLLRRYFRGDAAFALPGIYEFLEAEGRAVQRSLLRVIAEQPVESADGISISRVGHVGDVVGAHDVGGETADASENAGVFADATGVLAHGDITRIVVPVFNPPVCPDGAAGGVGGEHGVRHVVGGFAGQVPEAGRGVAFEAAAVDPNDGGDKGCPFGVAEMGARIEDLDLSRLVSRPRGVDGLMAVERLALVA